MVHYAEKPMKLIQIKPIKLIQIKTWRAREYDEGKEWQPKGSVFLYNFQFREDGRLEESTEKHMKMKYEEFKKENCQ